MDKTSVMLPSLQQLPASDASAATIVDQLDARIGVLLGRIQEMEAFQIVMNPESDPAFVKAILRELYLEIYSYQPHVIEATVCAIAQMPRSIGERKFKSMLLHQAEEFEHGEMALRDYIALGGDETFARNRRISPASFAVGGMWLMLAHMRDPFMYLGAVYLFEGLTPIISNIVKEKVDSFATGIGGKEFIEFHSTEDIRHTNLMRHLLTEVAKENEGAAEAMLYGIDCFLHVYPLPVWETAYERAKAQRDG